jgi:hypothetical protein
VQAGFHLKETVEDFGRNSVANYMPLQNYLAMLDEGRRFGRA